MILRNKLRWQLKELYSLTPRQMDMAIAFLDTADISKAASAIGIIAATGRTYMQAIYQKTETHSRPQLMKLLMEISYK